MADREDKPNLPPIPDGGLTDTMPDWLRRPPAWRALPDREVTVPAPDDDATLPEPDESVIDPRTFLDDDDLPAWLRRLGPGRTPQHFTDDDAAGDDSEGAVQTSEPAQPAEGDQSSGSPRFRPTDPPAPMFVLPPENAGSRTTAHQQASPLGAAPSPTRQPGWIIALLASLLVVAIAVIVVLAL